MKKTRRLLAVFLAAAVLFPTAQVSAGASAPAVSADETVYVNLDYYGKTSDVNIVKGYSLNGNSKITDYGSYDGVLNMSNEARPQISGDAVTWNLPAGTQSFYSQYTPKDKNVSLPWTFDISYKLNGMPTDPGKLAGVSGLVEIDVKATPNKNVSSYLKNNMLLELGTAFKMKDTYSLEAPGAQLQALGEYKAVVFAAVPGEEKEYTIRVGTKKFDTVGLLMMMEPGTLNTFKDIKDIKSDKDKVKSSLDAINDSTDSILDTLTEMTGGITGIESGLNSADAARSYISQNKGSVYQNADAAIASLSSISKQMSAMIPHMQEGESAVQDVNADINTLNTTLQSTSGTLYSLSNHIGSLKDSISDLRDTLDNLDATTEDAADKLSDLKSELKDEQAAITTDKAVLQSATKTLSAQNSALLSSSAALSTDLSTLLGSDLKEKLAEMQAAGASGAELLAFEEMLEGLQSDSTAFITALDTLSDTSKALPTLLNQLSGESTDILGSSASLMGTLEGYLDDLHDGHDSADKLLKTSNLIGGDIQSLLDSCQKAITDVNNITGTANKYKSGAIDTLKDSEALTGSLSSGIGSAQSFLTSLESLMKTSGTKLDDAAKKTLGGSISVLQKSLEGIGKTDTIRNASDTINKTVDNEIDKYEKDNNLLNLDYEAKPVSFTSSKNPAPSSVQIVMRTQEITTENNSQNIKDQEKADSYVSPLARIGNIFAKIWSAIQSIFSGG